MDVIYLHEGWDSDGDSVFTVANGKGVLYSGYSLVDALAARDVTRGESWRRTSADEPVCSAYLYDLAEAEEEERDA